MEVENDKMDVVEKEPQDVSNEELTIKDQSENQPTSDRNFTSEIYKIELQNLPKFYGIGQMKKLLVKNLKLNVNKLKPVGKEFMFVCFRNEEDKNKALSVLDGYMFKGKKLKAVSAKAADDPYKKNKKLIDVTPDTRPLKEKIQEKLCAYANLSYEQQLDKKLGEIVTIVKQLGSEVSRCNTALNPIIKRMVSDHGVIAPILEFLKSPVTRGYRNKVEFSVGYMTPEKVPTDGDVENGEESKLDIDFDSTPIISVGIRLASYKQGNVEVISLSSMEWPEDVLPHISPAMIKIGILFEQFVRASGILPYSSITNKGNWRNLMLRTGNGGCREQTMVVAVLDPKDLSSEQIDQVKRDLVSFFSAGGAAESCQVTSLFLHLAPAKRAQGSSEPVPLLLSGDDVITETLHNKSFNISPQAFFQINTQAAEILYQCVGDLADLTDKSTLVDVCCGTGTIALCLANRVKKVIGVELIAEAVRDARKNATANDVQNCSFFAGRAENILQDVLRDIDSKDIVAVVDPPRAGLHAKALSAIRNNLYIKKLVYVSCDAKAAMKNFVDLCRPESKTARGDPFLPRKIVPVDLFPHTPGFELVIYFERISAQEIAKFEVKEESGNDKSFQDNDTSEADNENEDEIEDVTVNGKEIKKEKV